MSLAGADFNHDTYPDFVAGYRTENGGLLAIHLADQEAFAPVSAQSIRAIAKGEFPEAFQGAATAIPLPEAPEILTVADFDADGNADILFAAEHSPQFYILSGDGAGNFSAPRVYPVPGAITAIATAPPESGGLGASLAVSLQNGSRATILVYAGSPMSSPARYSFDDAIGSIAIGDLDGDRYRDVVFVTGGGLYILHGNSAEAGADPGRIETVPVESAEGTIALGHFVGDSDHGTDIALLSSSGGVRIASRAGSTGTVRVESYVPRHRSSTPLIPQRRPTWQPGRLRDWSITDVTSGSGNARRRGLLSARLAGKTNDTLLAITGKQLTVLSPNALSPISTGTSPLEQTVDLGAAGALVAALPMRTSVMGATGFVALGEDELEPIAADSQPGVTFHVTGLADSQSGSCTTPSGSPASSSCTTLRAAIIAANANPGQDLIVFDSNGTITLSVPGLDDAAAVGDLDVTDALTIVGNGISNTIIQGGTSSSTGIDKIFSFNPMGSQPGFAVSISGMTMQFGQNAATDFSAGNSAGGAFDFLAGLDGAGSLSVSNCAVLQNSTRNGDGGGVALFEGGTVTIANTTISGNKANMQGPDEFNGARGFYGGGVFIEDPGVAAGTVAIANSTISGNLAVTPNQVPPLQQGGGVYSLLPNTTISGSTISGNQANSDGGGLCGAFVPDQGPAVLGSSIVGNTSGGLGGGVAGVFVISNSNVSANSAASGGGGLYSFGPGSTISGSRIAGNTSTQGASAIDGDVTLTASVTAANNWWGSNSSPASAINSSVVTFTPWLVMTLAASPTTINTGSTSTVTASINTGSDGSTGFHAPDGTPVTFGGTLGTGNPTGAATTAGAATSTYTAGSTAGSGSVTATADSQTLSIPLTITAAPSPAVPAVTSFSGGTVFLAIDGTSLTIGWSFTANSNLTATSLGFWCIDTSAPLNSTHQVGLWTASGTLLASATVQMDSPVTGSWRYVSIPPVSLIAGQTYIVGGALTSPFNDAYQRVPFSGGSVTTSPLITIGTSYNSDSASGFTFPGTPNPSYVARFGPNLMVAPVSGQPLQRQ